MYCRDFTFKADRCEEIIVGIGTHRSDVNCIITGEVLSSDTIHFSIQNPPPQFAPVFVLPILGTSMGGDVLPDRIMYGRLPQFNIDTRPMIPVVCELFNSMNTIRFAFLNPLRTVEFHGQYV